MFSVRNQLHLVVPTILVTVFCIQYILVQHYNLSQWKGGGFGMFSTIDSPNERSLKIILNTDDGQVSVNKYSINGFNIQEINKIETIPCKTKLQALHKIIISKTWVCNSFYDSGENQVCRTAKVHQADQDFIPLQFESVTIGVERLTYDRWTNKVGTDIILKQTFPN